MGYASFQQGSDMYIASVIFSMLLTVLGYGVFPFAFAKIRKHPITKKKYKRLCYGINFIVKVFFIALVGGSSNYSPFLLWTWIFSKYGIKELGRRGIMPDSDHYTSQPNRFIECKHCKYKQKTIFEPCPRCGKKGLQFVVTNELIQTPHTLSSPETTHNPSITPNTNNAKKNSDDVSIWTCCNCNTKNLASNNKCWSCGNEKPHKQFSEEIKMPVTNEEYAPILFCRKCGERLAENSAFCRKCGTKAVKEPLE